MVIVCRLNLVGWFDRLFGKLNFDKTQIFFTIRMNRGCLE